MNELAETGELTQWQSVMKWMEDNPLLVIAGGIGAFFLLFGRPEGLSFANKNPVRRRRRY